MITIRIALAIAFVGTGAHAAIATARPVPQMTKDGDVAPMRDYRRTWKEGPNTYGFEGASGGCHYHGTVGPSAYHLDRSC